jgi:hypothetical protein
MTYSPGGATVSAEINDNRQLMPRLSSLGWLVPALHDVVRNISSKEL